MKTLRFKIENENYLSHLIRKYFLNNSEVLELNLKPDKNFTLQTETAIRDSILSKQRLLSLGDRQKIEKETDALKEYQATVQNVEVLPKLTIKDIQVEVPRTGYSIESIKKTPVMFVEGQFNGLSTLRLFIDISDISEGLLPYVNILEHFFGELGTKSLRYDDFNEALCQVADGISVSTEKYPHPTQSDQFIHFLSVKISCLDRNIDKALSLLTSLLVEPDLKDTARLSQLIQMTASDLSHSLVENAVSYAMHASAIGFDYLGSRANEYSDTQFMLNLAKTCLKSSDLKIVLEDLAFHMDFLLKKLFQKGKLKICVHTDNKKGMGKEIKKMLTALEQVYTPLKNDTIQRASKSRTFCLH